MVSVVLLVVMCRIYLAHGNPESVSQGNPNTVAAVSYTLLLAAPYAFIILLCLRPDPPQLLFEFARTLSRATIIGIVFITVVSGLGFLLFLMMIPNALADVGIVAGEIGGQLQGPGLVALLALFVTQFALKYCARRAVVPGAIDYAGRGAAVGYATLLLPILIFAHISAIRASSERTAVEKSVAETETRQKAESIDVERRTRLALEVARTSVHVCVHANCTDSLVAALKKQNIILKIVPNKEGGFFAVATADEYAPTMYTTDETGMVLRKSDHTPLRTVTSSYVASAPIVDSAVMDLKYIRDCIGTEATTGQGEYPLHLRGDVGCRLRSDTTIVQLRDGTAYRVIYTTPPNWGARSVKSFSLAARPVLYGKPAVRSFLITEDSVYVTTANRPARKSDPTVWRCEIRPDDCK